MFRQQRQLPNSIGVSKCFYFIKVIKSLEKEIEPTQRKVIFKDFFCNKTERKIKFPTLRVFL